MTKRGNLTIGFTERLLIPDDILDQINSQSNQTIAEERRLVERNQSRIADYVQIEPFPREQELSPMNLEWKLVNLTQTDIHIHLDIDDVI